MLYPVKKFSMSQKEKLVSEGREIFAPEFFEEALLSFLESLGELSKTVRNGGNRKEIMLAYVNGFRYALNVGIALQCQEDISQPNLPEGHKDMTKQLFDIYEKALTLRYTLKDHTFYALFSSYLGFGHILGFNFDDITYVYENEK